MQREVSRVRVEYHYHFGVSAPVRYIVHNELKVENRGRQIAFELNVSEATVKAHVTAIFRKLNVRTRTQAALLLQQMESIPSS